MSRSKKSDHYPRELRERAVRMVEEQAVTHASQWAAIVSVAVKLGCSAESLRRWVRQAERDRGERRALEREVDELRQANEILRKASAYFAQAELDRRHKT
jgi:transposase